MAASAFWTQVGSFSLKKSFLPFFVPHLCSLALDHKPETFLVLYFGCKKNKLYKIMSLTQCCLYPCFLVEVRFSLVCLGDFIVMLLYVVWVRCIACMLLL